MKKICGCGNSSYFSISHLFLSSSWPFLAPADQGTTIIQWGIIGIEIGHLSVLVFILLPTPVLPNLLNFHRADQKAKKKISGRARLPYLFSGFVPGNLKCFFKSFLFSWSCEGIKIRWMQPRLPKKPAEQADRKPAWRKKKVGSFFSIASSLSKANKATSHRYQKC